MHYLTALDAIVNRGIEASKRDYRDKPDKLAGAIAGFSACRDKTPLQLLALLEEANKATHEARNRVNTNKLPSQEYWKIRCYEAEIEWVCNCVSVLLTNQGEKSPFPHHVGPTARAFSTVASIVGVAAPS